eukprot:TRINITY_DN1320_c0_g4_i1.p1 TRINITY_DN1320_c0_g4~~TRINITY_DN1320_c0_g4_i1.p1  ORF type:complete len:196 (-),score=35.67 TRINITY_DN1320_c0_g4_i1:142-729(-)
MPFERERLIHLLRHGMFPPSSDADTAEGNAPIGQTSSGTASAHVPPSSLSDPASDLALVFPALSGAMRATQGEETFNNVGAPSSANRHGNGSRSGSGFGSGGPFYEPAILPPPQSRQEGSWRTRVPEGEEEAVADRLLRATSSLSESEALNTAVRVALQDIEVYPHRVHHHLQDPQVGPVLEAFLLEDGFSDSIE